MPLSSPWHSYQGRVSWSYFQLMHEHCSDSGAGHSCPTWDLPMGTLCLETLRCPAKISQAAPQSEVIPLWGSSFPLSLHRRQTCIVNQSLPLPTPDSSTLSFAVFPSISQSLSGTSNPIMVSVSQKTWTNMEELKTILFFPCSHNLLILI